uniref:tRNA (cytosine(38)-C(5))-methyltransferase n=1 Tax=Mastacembelus armatus TaxID=205130 RepID=A0A7N8WLW2_9TELE
RDYQRVMQSYSENSFLNTQLILLIYTSLLGFHLSFKVVFCFSLCRIGRQGDIQDPRTKSFLYILDLLPRSSTVCNTMQRFKVILFLAGDLMVQTLKDCGYTFEEIMVSPTSVGIPNSRLRYYLLAKISPENVGTQTSSEVSLADSDRHVRTCIKETLFYGRYVEGTGSVLQCSEETEMQSVFRGLDQHSEEDKLQRLLKLKLRYFTPREVANLMGFPQSFSFPAQIPTKQQYKVLGNSLNVVVVAKLLRQLVS